MRDTFRRGGHDLHVALRRRDPDLRGRHGAQHHRRGGDRRASLNGGSGTILGAILGIALLSVVTSSLILLDVSVYWQDMIKGCILLAPFRSTTCCTSGRLSDMPNAKPKSMSAPREEIVIARQMHQALVLHFLEGLTQAQIADQLGISHATVNRLIKRGRQLGLVEIKIKSPVEPLVEIEEQLLALGGIRRAVVVPTVSDNPQIALQSVGEAAARLMLEQIADGDTICITGGKGVSAVVAGLQPSRRFDIEVIPATGCVQGKHYTDVNHVSTMMADRLGGHSFQIHAPLFADSEAERKMLLGMRSVADVFKRARDAKIAVVGIGSILSDDSSYYTCTPPPAPIARQSSNPAPPANCWRICSTIRGASAATGSIGVWFR